ncbi:ankyrin repeat domain-containing protein 17 isoform X3 [Sitophilus oryzae]|uniref:Ankyrin repeat domain-containing protein 17 isoform X3 n=1 Tax=Sitophilus oryzae TaxID=7048 RepID=A0A6J2XZI1_SITOR|nr:ankyrin repeat domain-containing protein 17 isoform X3 [Sitophilus oryzae]
MQNVPQDTGADESKLEKLKHGAENISSTPQSTNSTPTKSETETYSENRRFMSETSESEEDSVSEVESFMVEQEFEDEPQAEAAKFLLGPDQDRAVDPETQAHLEELLQVAGISQLAAKDSKALGDPEVLRRLTSSVSCALDEAAAALTRMRSDNAAAASSMQAPSCLLDSISTRPTTQGGEEISDEDKTALVEACNDGDVGTVRKLLTEGRSVHETSEEGESLLSLACSAGYFELAQHIRNSAENAEDLKRVLLAMHANVEDRGIKGECTPLMEAASAGHLDIVRLLIHHGADVNAQSTSGNTPLMYACAGGHTEVVEFLLENGAHVEDHNENGHTPLMEAASAGHVGLAKILLMHGAGINTHSNEFKESALTLACYKGHLDMVRFLLEAGADQEHKTDEMHTALMEASMDGHVEVARLLLDSGAQVQNVNMPTDSFESPLTLAACGGHVDLAMLLIERGANIEEVNDEGYTPLMEAAREGHEEMVHLLLGQGANINAQTDETQETALTLACCGGFMEVADILIKGGADIELGASTPLMEAAQEGHIDLVRFLLEYGANVNAVTQTNDTALTYACENGHTDVSELLLQYGGDLEHESEGGRTPLMKACRAGHLCTAEFLIKKGANVRKQTTNNDHTPLSLACAGGHLAVVELLLKSNADPNHKLKDNSTMLIEAAKGGHTNVVQLLLDYPHSMLLSGQQGSTAATNLAMLPGQVGTRDASLPAGSMAPAIAAPGNFFSPPTAVLQEVPEAVRIVQQVDLNSPPIEVSPKQQVQQTTPRQGNEQSQQQQKGRKLLAKSRSTGAMFDGALTSAEAQQVRTPPLSDFEEDATAAMEFLNKEDPHSTLIDFIKKRKQFGSDPDGNTQKQQILEELHRVERELHGKQQQAAQQQAAAAAAAAAAAGHGHVFQYQIPQEQCALQATTAPTALAPVLNFDLAIQQQQKQQGLGYSNVSGASPQPSHQVPFYAGIGTPLSQQTSPQFAAPASQAQANQTAAPTFYFTPMPVSSAPMGVSLGTPTATVANGGVVSAPAAPGLGTLVPASALTAQPIKFQSVAEVSQNTAINDRPKVKPIKKEGKNIRKQQQQVQHAQPQPSSTQVTNQNAQNLNQSQPQTSPSPPKTFNIFGDQQVQMFRQLQLPQQPSQPQQRTVQNQPGVQFQKVDGGSVPSDVLNVQDLDVTFLKDDQESLLTASILQQIHNTSIPFIRAATVGSPQKSRLEVYDPTQQDQNSQSKVTKLELTDKDFPDDVVQTLEVQPYPGTLDETMIASLTAAQQADLQAAAAAAAAATGTSDLSRVEYFAVPTGAPGTQTTSGQVPVHALYNYEHYLTAGGMQKDQWVQGFQAGYSLKQQQLADSLTVAGSVAPPPLTNQPQTFITSNQPQACVNTSQQPQQIAACGHATQGSHICQPCGQHQQQPSNNPSPQQVVQQQVTSQQPQGSNQVQAATQTQTQNGSDGKKIQKVSEIKFKKGRVIRHQNSLQNNLQQDQNYQIDHNSAITQYSGANNRQCANSIISPCMDVDSETESNHDTALTLACAGGHEELVELLISRGADIEHRDKKGFTPLILAATAGHEKVVDILLNHNADIEAQSERTKDTPLSLACSGGRYEVVELLLNRNANKEHRNVSDYTPLSLAASGGYVNIIRLLLSHGAEINSRTGSKLGISPLMLAAMNGHTSAVKVLLDMGSDINAQIETNRNTALTLACFQGRHEVVALLLERKANVEHRAKTGLTPLMEAASGGYVDVGKVLVDKKADVNATPVPSSRDTALTIAADKGHAQFVELLLEKNAMVEVKNKKGNSPLWLAANGGHLAVIQMLYDKNADLDSQDNRKVSCLMAAFRKGHVKVVEWMVEHVTQFPSDQEMMRYIGTISDKELLEKCHECVKLIRAAKETQADRANKNASILLEELESERTQEEIKRIAAAKRREKKKQRRWEKKEQQKRLQEQNKKNVNYRRKLQKVEEKAEVEEVAPEANPVNGNDKEEGDSGIDANSQGSCSSNDIKTSKEKRKNKKNKKTSVNAKREELLSAKPKAGSSKSSDGLEANERSEPREKEVKESKSASKNNMRKNVFFAEKPPKAPVPEVVIKSPADRDDFEATGNETYVASKNRKEDSHAPCQSSKGGGSTSPKQATKREDGWKEVVRKSSVQTVSESGAKKVLVPLNAISRVIGRGGSNINAIRQHTGALIEVEKQGKGQGDRAITIKGAPEATRQAHALITALIKDPDVDIASMLSKTPKPASAATTLWDKTQIATKKNAGKLASTVQTAGPTVTSHTKVSTAAAAPTSTVRFASASSKYRSAPTTATTRVTAPRLAAQVEKNAQAQQSAARLPVSSATVIRSVPSKIITTLASQTFAAKLTETVTASQALSSSIGQTSASAGSTKLRSTLVTPSTAGAGPVSPQPPIAAPANTLGSPVKSARPQPTGSAPPTMQHFQSTSAVKPQLPHSSAFASNLQTSHASSSNEKNSSMTTSASSNILSSSVQTSHQQQQDDITSHAPLPATSEYTLFCPGDYWNRREQEPTKLPNFASVASSGSSQNTTQVKFIDQEPPPQVDITKAPGYRGVAVCSPVSSKTSSNSTTPPTLSAASYQGYQEATKSQNALPPIGSRPQVSQSGPGDFMPFMDFNKPGATLPNLMGLGTNEAHLLQNTFNPIQSLNFSQPQPPVNIQQSASMSRLNPKAPEYSGSAYSSMQNKSGMYNGFQIQMQNNVFALKGNMDAAANTYHRGMNNASQQNRSWIQQVPSFTQQQNELISGLAGMTIQNLQAKVYGEGLENGAELAAMVNNSPNMSPNLAGGPPHGLHADSGHFGGMEERKPQPIGTGRARKAYPSQMDQNWMLNEKQANWGGNGLEFNMRPPPMYQEDTGIDFSNATLETQLQRPMQMENYMNNPGPYFNHQHPNLRPDFISDMPKLDLSWDNGRPIPELQDKHGWQWNK